MCSQGLQTQRWNWGEMLGRLFLKPNEKLFLEQLLLPLSVERPQKLWQVWSSQQTDSSSKLINLSASFFNQRSVFILFNSLFLTYIQTAEEQVM